jgi:hypothetical protein
MDRETIKYLKALGEQDARSALDSNNTNAHCEALTGPREMYRAGYRLTAKNMGFVFFANKLKRENPAKWLSHEVLNARWGA